MISFARLGRLVLCIAVATAMTACADKRGGPIPYDIALAAPDVQDPVPDLQSDLIRPTDQIEVKVFQVPDLSGSYTVNVAGDISMPLIGDVRAAGRTPAELKLLLEQSYGKKYLQKPTISVTNTQPNPRTITVEGAVRSPGIYPIRTEMTLMRALAQASGTSDIANERRVIVFRNINGSTQAAAFDLVAIRDGASPDPRIYGNDVIVVVSSGSEKTWQKFVQTIPLITFARVF